MTVDKLYALIAEEILRRIRLDDLSLEELVDVLKLVERETPQTVQPPSRSGTLPAIQVRPHPRTLGEGVHLALAGAGRPLTGTEIVQVVQRMLPDAQDGSIRAEVSRQAKRGAILKLQDSHDTIPVYQLP